MNTDPTADDDAQTAARWIAEIELAEKDATPWADRCKKIIRRYKDERTNPQRRSRQFAILWSNIQILGPATYARTPQANVSRRFKDEDPVGRLASEILERCLNSSAETYGFDQVMKQARDSYLLLARGQAWERYVPHWGEQRTNVFLTDNTYTDDTGQAHDEENVKHDAEGPHVMEPYVKYEETCTDYISWDDFLTNAARTWAEVRWVAKRVFMTRDEMVERFGEKGSQVPLNWTPTGADERPGPNDQKIKKGIVFEIWDKVSRKAIWVAKGVNELLDIMDDPLGLNDFFPCPRPLLGTVGPDSIIPIPDFIYYQDQADEINDLTARIGTLADALRMVGVYAGEHDTTLAKMFKGDNNELIPIDSMAALKDSGGVKGIIEWLPIDMVIQTIKACIETRKQLIEDIHEITGISDIIRGATDPNETATAQGIKAQWGSLRVRDRQRELERFARDVLRIKAQVIASKFSVDTLKAVSGVKLLTNAEKQQATAQYNAFQQQVQMAQQAGQPAPQPPLPPEQVMEIQRLMGEPSWEDVEQLLHDSAMRTFRIDVETDSTIEPNEQEDKAKAVEYVQALGEFLAKSLPVAQASPQAVPIIMEALKFVNRRFRVGREMEDIIDKAADQIIVASQQPPAPPQPDPVEAGKLQIAQQSNQIKAAQVQQEGVRAQADVQIAQTKVQAEAQRTQADAMTAQHAMQLAQQQHQLAAQGQMHDQGMARSAADQAQHEALMQTVLKAQELQLKREIMENPPKPAGAK